MDSVLQRARKKPLLSALAVVLFALLLFALFVLTRTPLLNRDWKEHLAVMPAIEMSATDFTLGPATDWTYAPDGPTENGTVNFAANYADLRNVWFMVEPQPGGGYAAHTLVLFEFAGDRIIGLTVEARQEKNEKYDALEGLFNKFELAYIWSTSKELLTRRAVFLKKDVYVYPLHLEEKQKGDFLKALLQQTTSVETKPRFYNTFTSNCTNELGKVARIPWHYSFILTGYSPQYLNRLKYIPGDDFEAVKAKAKLDPEIREWNSLPAPDFDKALLAELHKRFGETP
ncbi:MAG TPA: DUF4105 domain-containing protein [Hyphomonadaceae bacterium]|jgi:hypothetical protein|nr:DUF4105 domain-containing protein [Hyphomonadaceae bacterium]